MIVSFSPEIGVDSVTGLGNDITGSQSQQGRRRTRDENKVTE